MKHKADPVYKYQVEFVESERGWGQDYWTALYGTLEEAQRAIRETNAQNTSLAAPDYYIKAFDEIKKVEVDRDGKPC